MTIIFFSSKPKRKSTVELLCDNQHIIYLLIRYCKTKNVFFANVLRKLR